jgi:hypothetical protein
MGADDGRMWRQCRREQELATPRSIWAHWVAFNDSRPVSRQQPWLSCQPVSLLPCLPVCWLLALRSAPPSRGDWRLEFNIILRRGTAPVAVPDSAGASDWPLLLRARGAEAAHHRPSRPANPGCISDVLCLWCLALDGTWISRCPPSTADVTLICAAPKPSHVQPPEWKRRAARASPARKELPPPHSPQSSSTTGAPLLKLPGARYAVTATTMLDPANRP